jgi:hypothetical protein
MGMQVSNTWADVAFSDALPFASASVVLSQVQTPAGHDSPTPLRSGTPCGRKRARRPVR